MIKVREGKYVKIFREEPLEFGFEDLTEEIGEHVDWDFNEPRVKVVEESGFVKKTVKLECYQGGAYDVALYYGDIKVYDSKIHGKKPTTVEFQYIEMMELIPLALIALPVVILGIKYLAPRTIAKHIITTLLH